MKYILHTYKEYAFSEEEKRIIEDGIRNNIKKLTEEKELVIPEVPAIVELVNNDFYIYRAKELS